MLRRAVLRDVALLLFAVVTVAAAVFVVTRSPAAVPEADRLAPQAVRTGSPPPARVRALFVGGSALVSTGSVNIARLAGDELDWDVLVDAAPATGYVTGPPGSTFRDRVPKAVASGDLDVVVIVSSASETAEADPRVFGGSVQSVLDSVREAQPEAYVILVGPIAAAADALALHRQILTDACARFGAFFVDPVGRRYLEGRPDAVQPDGTLTPAGAAQVARRLAAALRVVLPPTLLPSPSPSPSLTR